MGRIRIISVVSTDTSVKVSVDTPVAISVECRSTFSIRYMILSFFCSHESYCGWPILNVLQLVSDLMEPTDQLWNCTHFRHPTDTDTARR